jgi:multidrug efflux pump subunit AcrA (membrane-fusion protein)
MPTTARRMVRSCSLAVAILGLGVRAPAQEGDGRLTVPRVRSTDPQGPGPAARDDPAPPEVIDVINEVEGRTAIVGIVPEGQSVAKGQLICELDSTDLRDRLDKQEIAIKRAEDDHKKAHRTREVAVIALDEYIRGSATPAVGRDEGKLVEAKVKLALMLWLFDGSSIHLADKAVQEMLLGENQGRGYSLHRPRMVEDFASRREQAELEANVQKAMADELAKLATLRLERLEGEHLRRQIEKCQVRAPIAGKLLYANPRTRPGARPQPFIHERAVVQHQQFLFRIVPEVPRLQDPKGVRRRVATGPSRPVPRRVALTRVPDDHHDPACTCPCHQDPQPAAHDDQPPAKTVDIYNKVEGQAMIIRLAPEGRRVTKGETICELDSAPLRDRLPNQEIAVKRAEADTLNAQFAREMDEIALKEFTQGAFPMRLLKAQGELTLAEIEWQFAKDRLEAARRAAKAHPGGRDRVVLARLGTQRRRTDEAEHATEDQPLDLRQAEIDVLAAKIKRDIAADELRVLKDFTFLRVKTELEANIQRALANELAKKATHNLERQKEEKLRKQIDWCAIKAPADGKLLYANRPARPGFQPREMIEEGAIVREHQMLFQIVPEEAKPEGSK